jgi:hypothetical protein
VRLVNYPRFLALFGWVFQNLPADEFLICAENPTFFESPVLPGKRLKTSLPAEVRFTFLLKDYNCPSLTVTPIEYPIFPSVSRAYTGFSQLITV